MAFQLCLVACSGDKAAGGLCDKNTVYLFNNKHKKYVDDFLKAELDFRLYSLDHDFPNGNEKFYNKCSSTFRKLCNLGIFVDKWDFRTQWSMEIYTELPDLKMFKPYEVVNNVN